MAISYGSTGVSPDLTDQVNQLAKMALQSGDHMGFFQRYLTPANPNRLAAQLAQGLVQQQMQGAQTQQQLNPPQFPTVLDQKEQQLQQQGMAGMPMAQGMFDPSVYAQGGIGAGLGEEPQGPEQGQMQMARGGVVAFAGEGASLVGGITGSPSPFDLTPAEFDKLTKAEQRAVLDKIRVGAPTPASGIPADLPPARVAASGIAGPGAPPSVQAVTAPPAPAAPATPPPAAAAPAAAPTAKPGVVGRGLSSLGRIAKFGGAAPILAGLSFEGGRRFGEALNEYTPIQEGIRGYMDMLGMTSSAEDRANESMQPGFIDNLVKQKQGTKAAGVDSLTGTIADSI